MKNNKVPIIFRIMVMVSILFSLPVIALASHTSSYNLHLQAFDITTGNSGVGVDMDVDVFTTSTCSGTPIFVGTCTTDVNGVCDVNISYSMDYNEVYYACIYANNSLISGSPHPFRAGYGEITEEDVSFTNLTVTNKLTVGGDIDPKNIYITGNSADSPLKLIWNQTDENWWMGFFHQEEPYFDTSQDQFFWKMKNDNYIRFANNGTDYMQFYKEARFEDNINVTSGNVSADYFIGDGSQLTNIGSASIDIDDDEWLWFNTADTVGMVWNSTIGRLFVNNQFQINDSLLVSNRTNPSAPADTIEVGGNIILSDGNRFVYADTTGSGGYNLTVLGGSGGCFDSDTQITTPTGYTTIQNINVGDTVVSYDIATGTQTTSTVLAKDVSLTPSHYRINGVIDVTGHHPFYTQRGYVTAFELEETDTLFDGSSWIAITSIKRITGAMEGYVIAVDNTNNYYADGYLVSNKDTSARDGGQLYLNGGYGTYGGTDGHTWVGYDGFSANGYVIISGAYTLPNTDGTTGQILQTDGAGTTSWVNESTGTTYWNRTGTTLEPSTYGDDVNATGDLYVKNEALLQDGQSIAWDFGSDNWNSGIYQDAINDFFSFWTNTSKWVWEDYNLNERMRLDSSNGNLNVSGNMTASYFLGDGSQLTNLPVSPQYWNRTGTTLEPATYQDEVNVTGDLYASSQFFVENNIYCNNVGLCDIGSGANYFNNVIMDRRLYLDGAGVAKYLQWNNSRFEFNDNLYAPFYYGNISTAVGFPVTSVFGRTGDVTAQANDYTWNQINKTVSSIADITTRDISKLSDVDTTGVSNKDVLSYNLTSANWAAEQDDKIQEVSCGSGTISECYNSGTSYITVRRFAFDGSNDVGTPTKVKFVGCGQGSTGDVRIYDVTNSQVIAEVTGMTDTYPTFVIYEDTTLTNIPTGDAVWELQVLSGSAGGTTYGNIASATIYWE